MPLKLNVPAIEEKPVVPAETRPKKVQEMISALSFSNATEAATDLKEALSLLNRQKIGADTRLKLLEILRPAVLDVLQRLATQFCGIALPLSDKAKEAVDTSHLLAIELAYGYKQALLEQQSKLFSFGGGKPLAFATCRAIQALDRILLISYQTYTQPQAGLWSEIHRLYLHAVQESLQDMVLGDEGKPSSINLAYKRALLMALANPGQLTTIDIERLANYLDRYAGHAQIHQIGSPESTSGIFLIQLERDIAAIPLAKNKKDINQRSDILLITIDLARMLHNQISMLQAHEPPKNLGLPDSATDPRYQDMLIHLLKHWGNTPKRMFNRLNKKDMINITVGLACTHYFLNGKSPYMVAATAGEQEDQEITLNQTNSSANQDNKEVFSSAPWLIVNESAGGLALSSVSNVQINVHVGDLLGMKSDQAQQWSVGEVRRVSINASNNLEIGVQMLAPTAKAIAVRPIDKSRFEIALLLPEIPALKQPATLITQRGMFLPAQVMDVDQNGTSTRIMATRLVERTNRFERFQYSHFDR